MEEKIAVREMAREVEEDGLNPKILLFSRSNCVYTSHEVRIYTKPRSS